MDNSLFRSPIARIVAGGADILSLVLFAAVWVATLVTSGFSLAGTQTYAGWTYFPVMWPHLAAATLGFLLFLRYGANYATALAVALLWTVAFISDIFGAVVYWKLFWLCNIGPKSELSGVALGICDDENPLLISMMVLATVLWFISIAGALAHFFDFFQAGRGGSVVPGRQLSGALFVIAATNIVSFLVFLALWITNWITTAISVGGGQTYAVWTHANILLVQISATVVGIMLFLRYGANWITAAAAIILWIVAFFSAFYVAALYWRLGWMCKVSTASTLSGNDLVICTQEEPYLIALWVLVSIQWFMAIMAPVAHAFDLFRAGRYGSVKIRLGGSKSDTVDGAGVSPEEDLNGTNGSSDVSPMDQYMPLNDGGKVPYHAMKAGAQAVLQHTNVPIQYIRATQQHQQHQQPSPLPQASASVARPQRGAPPRSQRLRGHPV